ncbi:MAG: V-type ATPase 116kDa subunit family protein [Gammaproteobacteria bacterium]
MFRPVPMQRVYLQVLREDAHRAALILAESGCFDPQPSSALEADLPESPGIDYRERFESAHVRLQKLCDFYEVEPELGTLELRVVEQPELEEADRRLGELWREASDMEEQLRRLDEERREVAQLRDTLKKFSGLDVDLGHLQRRKRFLNVQVGTVPEANLSRLTRAVELAGQVLTPFLVSEGVAYVVVAGPMPGDDSELARLLDAAGFRPVNIPEEFRDHPAEVERELRERAEELDRRRQALLERKASEAERIAGELTRFHRLLTLAAPYAKLADAMRGRGGLTLFSGWVPSSQLLKLRLKLEEGLRYPFFLHARDPFPEEREKVPSTTPYPAWLWPFVSLVRNYGIPRYGEFDPTWLFTLSFLVMFGMMFGDVGQGAVIAVAGFFVPRRWRRIRPAFWGAGSASMVFGFLYGSVFGFEHWLEPVWIAPLSDPLRMLTVALYWGVGFILLTTLITIANRLAQGLWGEALLDGRGLAGALFYVAALWVGTRWFQGQPLYVWHYAAIVVPLAVIVGYYGYRNRERFAERVLVAVMEGFETVLAYGANTLSFLRLAAFSLNHVALAVAVFTLADMMGTAGYWVTVVVGNVIITVLEGAIVAIQVLRLEYYEGFSRFFAGSGRAYRPLRLGEESERRKHSHVV